MKPPLVPSVGSLHGLGPAAKRIVHFRIINGPNNAGKTTCVTALGILGVKVITTSTLLREAAAGDDPDREIIAKCLACSKLAPCHIAIRLVLAKIREILQEPLKEDIMFALDGIGRTALQMQLLAEGLPQILNELGPGVEFNINAVLLQLDKEGVAERVQSRIEEARIAGRPPRSEDHPDVWPVRFDEWALLEPEVEEAAKYHFGDIRLFNLRKHATKQLAALLFSEVYAGSIEAHLELIEAELERIKRKAVA